MTPEDVMQMANLAIWTVIKTAAPVILVGMGVGLVIALFQAMTQIQEMTLTFVPKILAIFLTLVVMMSFMGSKISELGNQVFDSIVSIK